MKNKYGLHSASYLKYENMFHNLNFINTKNEKQINELMSNSFINLNTSKEHLTIMEYVF